MPRASKANTDDVDFTTKISTASDNLDTFPTVAIRLHPDVYKLGPFRKNEAELISAFNDIETTNYCSINEITQPRDSTDCARIVESGLTEDVMGRLEEYVTICWGDVVSEFVRQTGSVFRLADKKAFFDWTSAFQVAEEEAQAQTARMEAIQKGTFKTSSQNSKLRIEKKRERMVEGLKDKWYSLLMIDAMRFSNSIEGISDNFDLTHPRNSTRFLRQSKGSFFKYFHQVANFNIVANKFRPFFEVEPGDSTAAEYAKHVQSGFQKVSTKCSPEKLALCAPIADRMKERSFNQHLALQISIWNVYQKEVRKLKVKRAAAGLPTVNYPPCQVDMTSDMGLAWSTYENLRNHLLWTHRLDPMTSMWSMDRDEYRTAAEEFKRSLKKQPNDAVDRDQLYEEGEQEVPEWRLPLGWLALVSMYGRKFYADIPSSTTQFTPPPLVPRNLPRRILDLRAEAIASFFDQKNLSSNIRKDRNDRWLRKLFDLTGFAVLTQSSSNSREKAQLDQQRENGAISSELISKSSAISNTSTFSGDSAEQVTQGLHLDADDVKMENVSVISDENPLFLLLHDIRTTVANTLRQIILLHCNNLFVKGHISVASLAHDAGGLQQTRLPTATTKIRARMVRPLPIATHYDVLVQNVIRNNKENVLRYGIDPQRITDATRKHGDMTIPPRDLLPYRYSMKSAIDPPKRPNEDFSIYFEEEIESLEADTDEKSGRHFELQTEHAKSVFGDSYNVELLTSNFEVSAGDVNARAGGPMNIEEEEPLDKLLEMPVSITRRETPSSSAVDSATLQVWNSEENSASCGPFIVDSSKMNPSKRTRKASAADVSIPVKFSSGFGAFANPNIDVSLNMATSGAPNNAIRANNLQQSEKHEQAAPSFATSQPLVFIEESGSSLDISPETKSVLAYKMSKKSKAKSKWNAKNILDQGIADDQAFLPWKSFIPKAKGARRVSGVGTASDMYSRYDEESYELASVSHNHYINASHDSKYNMISWLAQRSKKWYAENGIFVPEAVLVSAYAAEQQRLSFKMEGASANMLALQRSDSGQLVTPVPLVQEPVVPEKLVITQATNSSGENNVGVSPSPIAVSSQPLLQDSKSQVFGSQRLWKLAQAEFEIETRKQLTRDDTRHAGRHWFKSLNNRDFQSYLGNLSSSVVGQKTSGALQSFVLCGPCNWCQKLFDTLAEFQKHTKAMPCQFPSNKATADSFVGATNDLNADHSAEGTERDEWNEIDTATAIAGTPNERLRAAAKARFRREVEHEANEDIEPELLVSQQRKVSQSDVGGSLAVEETALSIMPTMLIPPQFLLPMNATGLAISEAYMSKLAGKASVHCEVALHSELGTCVPTSFLHHFKHFSTARLMLPFERMLKVHNVGSTEFDRLSFAPTVVLARQRWEQLKWQMLISETPALMRFCNLLLYVRDYLPAPAADIAAGIHTLAVDDSKSGHLDSESDAVPHLSGANSCPQVPCFEIQSLIQQLALQTSSAEHSEARWSFESLKRLVLVLSKYSGDAKDVQEVLDSAQAGASSLPFCTRVQLLVEVLSLPVDILDWFTAISSSEEEVHGRCEDTAALDASVVGLGTAVEHISGSGNSNDTPQKERRSGRAMKPNTMAGLTLSSAVPSLARRGEPFTTFPDLQPRKRSCESITSEAVLEPNTKIHCSRNEKKRALPQTWDIFISDALPFKKHQVGHSSQERKPIGLLNATGVGIGSPLKNKSSASNISSSLEPPMQIEWARIVELFKKNLLWDPTLAYHVSCSGNLQLDAWDAQRHSTEYLQNMLLMDALLCRICAHHAASGGAAVLGHLSLAPPKLPEPSLARRRELAETLQSTIVWRLRQGKDMSAEVPAIRRVLAGELVLDREQHPIEAPKIQYSWRHDHHAVFVACVWAAAMEQQLSNNREYLPVKNCIAGGIDYTRLCKQIKTSALAEVDACDMSLSREEKTGRVPTVRAKKALWKSRVPFKANYRLDHPPARVHRNAWVSYDGLRATGCLPPDIIFAPRLGGASSMSSLNESGVAPVSERSRRYAEKTEKSTSNDESKKLRRDVTKQERTMPPTDFANFDNVRSKDLEDYSVVTATGVRCSTNEDDELSLPPLPPPVDKHRLLWQAFDEVLSALHHRSQPCGALSRSMQNAAENDYIDIETDTWATEASRDIYKHGLAANLPPLFTPISAEEAFNQRVEVAMLARTAMAAARERRKAILTGAPWDNSFAWARPSESDAHEAASEFLEREMPIHNTNINRLLSRAVNCVLCYTTPAEPTVEVMLGNRGNTRMFDDDEITTNRFLPFHETPIEINKSISLLLRRKRMLSANHAPKIYRRKIRCAYIKSSELDEAQEGRYVYYSSSSGDDEGHGGEHDSPDEDLDEDGQSLRSAPSRSPSSLPSASSTRRIGNKKVAKQLESSPSSLLKELGGPIRKPKARASRVYLDYLHEPERHTPTNNASNGSSTSRDERGSRGSGYFSVRNVLANMTPEADGEEGKGRKMSRVGRRYQAVVPPLLTQLSPEQLREAADVAGIELRPSAYAAAQHMAAVQKIKKEFLMQGVSAENTASGSSAASMQTSLTAPNVRISSDNVQEGYFSDILIEGNGCVLVSCPSDVHEPAPATAKTKMLTRHAFNGMRRWKREKLARIAALQAMETSGVPQGPAKKGMKSTARSRLLATYDSDTQSVDSESLERHVLGDYLRGSRKGMDPTNVDTSDSELDEVGEDSDGEEEMETGIGPEEAGEGDIEEIEIHMAKESEHELKTPEDPPMHVLLMGL